MFSTFNDEYEHYKGVDGDEHYKGEEWRRAFKRHSYGSVNSTWYNSIFNC